MLMVYDAAGEYARIPAFFHACIICGIVFFTKDQKRSEKVFF